MLIIVLHVMMRLWAYLMSAFVGPIVATAVMWAFKMEWVTA